MPKVKIIAGKLKDLNRFYNYKAKEKYEEIIEPYKILEEKGFQFLKQDAGVINVIFTAATKRDWVKFCAQPRDPILLIIKEFYSNMLQYFLLFASCC